MKRAFVWSLSVLVVYLGVLMVGCQKWHSLTGGGGTTRTGVTQIDIKFKGAIAHVFATTTDGRPLDRAVMFLTNTAVDSTMTPYHLSEMILPDSVDTTALELATGTGILVDTDTDSHLTTVSPLDQLTIRLVGSDGTTTEVLQPALDKTDADFIKQVPRIYAASAKTMTDTELRDALRDPAAIPDGKDFAAFFVLEGGKFKSTPYCKETKFVKDHAGLGNHFFNEWLTLSGQLKLPPVLMIARGNGAAKPVGFVNPGNKILIKFKNLPSPPEPNPHSHFEVYRRLAKDPTKYKLPDTWDDVVVVKCSDHGAVPGCSNSAWP